MAEIKPLSRSSEKWKRQSQSSGPEYAQGVNDTKKDWRENTLAASDNYDAGVTAAIGNQSFQKGVERAGTEKWRKNTLAKGPGRWTEGISKSTDAYEKGFKPFHDVIASVTLPPRGPKGSAQNLLRVSAITQALHEKKKSLTS